MALDIIHFRIILMIGIIINGMAYGAFAARRHAARIARIINKIIMRNSAATLSGMRNGIKALAQRSLARARAALYMYNQSVWLCGAALCHRRSQLSVLRLLRCLRCCLLLRSVMRVTAWRIKRKREKASLRAARRARAAHRRRGARGARARA